MDRRTALLDWARRRQAAVIEDDYDSEFRFSARPLEPLYNLDGGGRVLYLGTFSKTMIPTVRAGFVLAPPALRSALVAARQLGGWHGQVAVQAALARFIEDGHLARHVRRARTAYADRHARIVAVLGAQELLDVVPSAAGLHVTALLRHGRSAPIVAAAREQGIAVDDLASYATGTSTGTAGFVFGFGAADPATMDDGLRRFADLLRRTATT
jgi:GntR family transcriptional regulator/MocR family aminotransferase